MVEYTKQEEITVFLTNPFDIKKLKEIKNKKIITFDYESHKILNDNKINHECSDDLISKNQLKLIDNACYRYSNWFKEGKISRSLIYDGINLGSLFYPEFHFYLVPIIKKIFELKVCTNIIKGSECICSRSFFEIVKLIFPSIRPFDNILASDSFLYDHINFGISKNLNIKMKRENYQKIKKKSEKIISKISNLNKKIDNKKKSIMFVEFDPIKYENLFSEIKNFDINPIFFNLRRPYFWNMKSFKIINQTKGTIITNDLLDKNNFENIVKKIENKEKIIQNIINYNELEKIFSLEEISFWKLIKNDFLRLYNKRIETAIEIIELARKTFEVFHISEIVIWSENGFNEQIIIEIAKKMNISINLMQHGIITNETEGFGFNKFFGVVPIKSDKFLAWEKSTSEYLIQCGIKKEKIKVIGSISLDKEFSSNMNKNGNESFILLITNGPKKITYAGYNSKFLDKYLEQLNSICSDVIELDKKMVVRPHPFSEEFNIEEIVNGFNQSISIDKKSSIDSLLKKCSLVIIIGVSTVIYEALVLEKPTIFIQTEHDTLGLPNIIKKNSFLITDYKKLKDKINTISNNEKFSSNLIKKSKLFLSSDFEVFGNSSRKLLENLKKNNDGN